MIAHRLIGGLCGFYLSTVVSWALHAREPDIYLIPVAMTGVGYIIGRIADGMGSNRA